VKRSNVVRTVRSSLSNPRCWVTAGLVALTVGGMVLGGLASPASAAGDLPSSVRLEQWADVGGNWVTSSLGRNGQGASAYAEGASVPFRLDVTSAGPGTFDFSVCRDYADGSKRGYLSLTPYSTSRLPVLGAVVVTDAADGAAQPFTGAAAVGSVTIDAVNEVGGQGTCGAGQWETQVRITISGTSDDAFVLWGGRLASPADAGVGAGNGASQFPGASLSMRLGGSAKNVSIRDAAIIPATTTTTSTTTTTTTTVPGNNDDEGPEPNFDPEDINDPVDIFDPADDPTTTIPKTTAAPVADPAVTIAGGGEQAALPAPAIQVLSGQLERDTSTPAVDPLASSGFLPRTGSGIGSQASLAFALVAAGLALLRLGRRPAPQQP
jgi:hypothetical protein